MKAFIAKHKYASDRNYLIISKNKKFALNKFKELQYHNHIYLRKDFIEVDIEKLEIRSLCIIPHNYKTSKENKNVYYYCFKPDINIQIKNHGYHDPGYIIIDETEQTYKEIVKLFKEQNKEMLQELF